MAKKQSQVKFVLLFIILDFQEIASLNPPKIILRSKFEYLPNGTFGSVIKDVPYFDSKNESVLVPENWGLAFLCQANYPIKFKTNGYIGKRNLRVSYDRRSDPMEYNDTSKFLFELFFTYIVERENTGHLSCVGMKNQSLFKDIHIFVTSDDEKSRVEFWNSQAQLKFMDPKIIPCSVYDPTLKVSLWKDGAQITNTKYDPRYGFYLENYSKLKNGSDTFVCHGQNTNFTFLRFETILKAEPEESAIAVFLNEVISVSCTCNQEVFFLLPSNMENLNITKAEETTKRKFLIITGKLGSYTFGCKCGAHSKTWHLQILEPLDIYVHSSLDSLICNSRENHKSKFTALFCDIRNTCEINKKCLDNGKCSKYFFNGTLINNAEGVEILSPPRSGIVQCSLNGAKKIVETFTGISGKRYFNISSALDANDLGAWDQIPLEMYTDEEFVFVCYAVLFIFSRHPRVLLTYKDGTKKILIRDTDYKSMNFEVAKKKARRGATFLAFKMNLTTEIDKVSCLHPYTDSNYWFELPAKLNVVKEAKPKIKNSETSITLIRGQTSQMTCTVSGKPAPEVVWSTSDKILNTTKIIKDGLVYFSINFENPTSGDEGEYICTATNRLGNDTKKFSTTVEELRSLTKSQFYGIIFGSILTVCILLGLLFMFWRRYSIAQKLLRDLSDDELEQFIKGKPDLVKDFVDAPEKAENMPYDYQYEIPIKELHFDPQDVLGSGAFGVVIKGVYRKMPVAIKMTKANADVSYFKALLSELKIMIYIGTHPNVVTFLGSFTQNIKNRVLYIIVELCKGGNLETRLRTFKNDLQSLEKSSSNEGGSYANSLDSEIKRVLAPVLNWPRQIADGMEYLSNKRVIHGDLAARNILLTEDDIAKITDFGLSRQLYQYSNYTKKSQAPLPWRWMAVESLTELVFSSKSDVWSFGILLWEIYSLGEIPFPAQQWTPEYTEMLQKGTRLKKPDFASAEIYEIMCHCWSLVPDKRPSFADISTFFRNVAADNP